MLAVELTEKELRFLQLMLANEIRENKNNITKITEEGTRDCYCFIKSLEEREDMLKNIKHKLHNTKREIEEEN